jgi:valyl-tRNA synthetase
VVSKLDTETRRDGDTEPTNLSSLTLADRWILSRYQRLVADVDRLMRGFNLGEAGRQIETFLWDDFADWYIEAAKVQLDDESRRTTTQAVLYTVLEGSLRLLHPYMPFVTEAAWQHLVRGQGSGVRGQGDTETRRHGDTETDNRITTQHPKSPAPQALIVAPYPQHDSQWIDESVERDWELTQEIVRGIRNIRNERGVEPARWIEAIIVAGDKTAMLESQRAIISRLARVDANKLALHESLREPPQQVATFVVGGVETHLPLAGMVDLAEERARLQKELERAEADVQRRRAKLANENFVSRAPAAVVQKERDALHESEATAAKLRERISALG